MIQKIKNILKKFVPLTIRIFIRENEKVTSRIMAVEKAQRDMYKQLAALEKQQKSILEQERQLLEELIKEKQQLKAQAQIQEHHLMQEIDRKYRKAMGLPILSVLIPVYNVEKYLADCLDSVINQSFAEIEIICVDDGSTDQSGQILEEYAQKDKRIKIIRKDKNEGLLLARKTAVEAATSEYIIFVDSDDIVSTEFCECVEQLTRNEAADIIQYNMGVQDFSNNSKKEEWLRKALAPIPRHLDGIEILEEAYIKRSYVTSILGKIFKTELCKKVYAMMPEEYCYVGEDIFTYFYMAYYAHSYKAVTTKDLYIYRHGLGVTNSDNMSVEKYEEYCKMGRWADYVYEVFIKDTSDSDLIAAYQAMVRRMITDCCNIYKDRIGEKDKKAALEVLRKYWGKNVLAMEVTEKMNIR